VKKGWKALKNEAESGIIGSKSMAHKKLRQWLTPDLIGGTNVDAFIDAVEAYIDDNGLSRECDARAAVLSIMGAPKTIALASVYIQIGISMGIVPKTGVEVNE
jgi:hypothetical protein